MKARLAVAALVAVGTITTATVVTNGEDTPTITQPQEPAVVEQQTVQPPTEEPVVPAAIQEDAPVPEPPVVDTPPPVVEEQAPEVPAEPAPEPPTVVFFNVIYDDLSSTQQAIYCYTEYSDGTNTKVRIGTRPTPGPGVPIMEVDCPVQR